MKHTTTRKTRHKHRRHLAELSLIIKRERIGNQLISYIRNHKKACLSSLDRILCTPFSSLLIITVIAIALALPVGLIVFLQNVEALSQNWNRATQISLYLKKHVTNKEAQNLATQIQFKQGIVATHYISPSEGLKELQKNIGLSDALLHLKENPLPGVIIVTPGANINSPKEFASLLKEFKKNSEVTTVQMDQAWVERLYYLVDLVKHGIFLLFVLFVFGIIITIGNTIRLTIQDAHKEIAILKLLGATDVFVRRQFLYSGFFYGLFGSIFSWIFGLIIILWLQKPVHNLALSYNSEFALQGLNLNGILILFGMGAFIGLAGARLGIRKQMTK